MRAKSVTIKIGAICSCLVLAIVCGCHHLCHTMPAEDVKAVVHIDWRSRWSTSRDTEPMAVDIYGDGRIDYSNGFPDAHRKKHRIDPDALLSMLKEIRQSGFFEVDQDALDAYLDENGITSNDAATTTLTVVSRGQMHTVVYEAMVVLDAAIVDINHKCIKPLWRTINIVHEYTGMDFR